MSCSNHCFYFMRDTNDAKKAIEDYLEANYGDEDFVIVDSFSNYPIFKYLAKVESPSSPDTYFEINYISEDRIEDTYEDDVLSGYNTFKRIENAYDALVNDAFDAHGLSFDYESIWGRYYVTWEDNVDELFIDPSTLELDREYDIRTLGADHGEIEIYAHDANILDETVEELMLEMKDILDEEDIPFRQMSVTLREPLDEDGDLIGHDRLEVFGVPYEEIEKESLLDYLQVNKEKE